MTFFPPKGEVGRLNADVWSQDNYQCVLEIVSNEPKSSVLISPNALFRFFDRGLRFHADDFTMQKSAPTAPMPPPCCPRVGNFSLANEEVVNSE